MSKVSRLFNASLDDPDRGPVICVADDGPGLADPRSLFTLGRSAWDGSKLADGGHTREHCQGKGHRSQVLLPTSFT